MSGTTAAASAAVSSGRFAAPKRILVVRAGAIGDTLMATPVLRGLHQRYPGAALDVLASETAAAVLDRHPGLRRVHRLRLRNLPYVLSLEKRRIARDLRTAEYELTVLLERAPRYRELLDRSGIRGETVRSFDETPFEPGAHAIENNLRAAGLDSDRVGRRMELHLAPDDVAKAGALLGHLDAGGPLVGIHVGYGPSGKKRAQSERLKGWPLESFATLGRELLERGAALVLTGSAGDRADVGALASRLGSRGVRNLAGLTTVRELGAVIQKLDLFVSVDSGPAHMAAALETPLVVLWGPAILEQVRPLSARSSVDVLRHSVPCAPCYGTPLMKTCRRNVCMESISPSEVLAAVRARVRLREPGRGSEEPRSFPTGRAT